MPKTLNERQQDLRERREREGLKRKEYWATEDQHKQIKQMLKDQLSLL